MNRHMVGTKHGMLTCLEILDERKNAGHAIGLFRCECGSLCKKSLSRVKTGAVRSCGCIAGKNQKHGMKGAPEYNSWRAMKHRCLNPQSKDYRKYGAKGITVHPEWVESFEAFYEHIGPRPKGTTLDRIDSSKGYLPGNVRWATPKIQARNTSSVRSVVIEGIKYETKHDAAKAHRVSVTTICRWCDGYIDRRRLGQKNGGARGPKEGCGYADE